MRKPRNNRHVRCRQWEKGSRAVFTSMVVAEDNPKELRLFAKRLITAAEWLESETSATDGQSRQGPPRG